MKKNTWAFVLLPLGIVILFLLNLYIGSVRIPFNDIVDIFLGRFDGKESWRFIVLENRLPQAITAMFCGGALAVSGLMLQTAFRNPLAGSRRVRYQCRSGLGCGTRNAAFGWQCVYGFVLGIGLYGGVGCSFCRCNGSNGTDILLLAHHQKQRLAAHHRHYGRLYVVVRGVVAQLLCHRRRRKKLH